MAPLNGVTCIDELRNLAQRRVPRAFFEYVEAGSYSEQTLRANRADLEKVRLRQRVMTDVADRDTSTTILGEQVALPIALAPVGLTGLVRGDGEILACKAAHATGVPYTLCTPSICSIEDVAAAVTKPFWFQLYVTKDRGFVRSLIERAAAARCSALVLTVDLPLMGQRHVDIRNGLSVPPALTPRSFIEMATKPRWALGMLSAKRRTMGNVEGFLGRGKRFGPVAQWIASQFDQSLNWKDVEWIRGIWPGKLVIKGILDVEDAHLAAASGADAVVVSNHGGRQLDGTVSSISALPRIVDAVGSTIEVLFDGGIRSGQDVLRAVALGARCCLIGRAYIYGLGAAGEAGVAKAIELIRKELDVSMALTGVRRIGNIGRHVLA
jgi:L-lactate dehydrogenase (cytochrome)